MNWQQALYFEDSSFDSETGLNIAWEYKRI
jgi:hypothetical protein